MSSVKRQKRKESARPVETTGSEVWRAGHKVDLKSMQVQASRLNCREKRVPAQNPAQAIAWVEVKEAGYFCENEKQIASSSTPAIEVRVGRYVVSVASGFDKTAFTDVCRVLTGLC
jgi:hypothetical protein